MNRSLQEELKKLMESMSHCMEMAMKEDPDSVNWTPEQIFEKGASWAGRHILITEEKPDGCR